MIVVLGAGVAGFTTAVTLLEAGHQVEVWAKAFPPNTTSNVAAAIWFPYRAEPFAKVKAWGIFSLKKFIELSTLPETNVSLVRGKKYFYRPVGAPWWKEHVPQFRTLGTRDLLEGTHSGYEITLPLAEMGPYLTYLRNRFEAEGGTCRVRELKKIDEVWEKASTVVNCTGLGSYQLLGDKELYPIRGQVLRVEKKVSEFFMETDHPLGIIYILPRSQDCVLGGTADDHQWDETLDEKTSQAIWHRSLTVAPELKGARILSTAVGLRPGRSEIRLEKEAFPQGMVIHNYGHGGSGMTLSWGCANEVLLLLGGAKPPGK